MVQSGMEDTHSHGTTNLCDFNFTPQSFFCTSTFVQFYFFFFLKQTRSSATPAGRSFPASPNFTRSKAPEPSGCYFCCQSASESLLPPLPPTQTWRPTQAQKSPKAKEEWTKNEERKAAEEGERERKRVHLCVKNFSPLKQNKC